MWLLFCGWGSTAQRNCVQKVPLIHKSHLRSKHLDSFLWYRTSPTQVFLFPAVSLHIRHFCTFKCLMSVSHRKWRIYFWWPPVKNLVGITTIGTLQQEDIKSYFLGRHPINLSIPSHLAVLSHFSVHFFKILHQVNLLQNTVLLHPYSKAILCTVRCGCILGKMKYESCHYSPS